MAPPHRGFALMRGAALRLALESPGVRSLINPRQTSPVEYVDSPLNEPDAGAAFHGGARAGMPAPEARLRSLQGAGHLTTLFGGNFVALYFSDNPDLPLSMLPLIESPLAAHARPGVAALRLVRVATHGDPDERTVVDELGQAWLRYDAADGTLYLIRPDGYVMGRWRAASAANIGHALRRVLGDRR
jgi:3-(3-hydroxy-phenyl)propionate hydroxylase